MGCRGWGGPSSLPPLRARGAGPPASCRRARPSSSPERMERGWEGKAGSAGTEIAVPAIDAGCRVLYTWAGGSRIRRRSKDYVKSPA